MLVFLKKNVPFYFAGCFSVIHWLSSWIILQKTAFQNLVAVASQHLAQEAKENFFFFFFYLGTLVAD